MIGIIGGTGLYKIDGINGVSSRNIDTPFGAPSAEILTGELAGKEVAFLPRHGSDHQILPSEINYRANIWALKSVGVRRIISVSAVGSLREEVHPGDLAIPSQYFDWTRGRRIGSFFGQGLVAHVSTAQPSCTTLSKIIQDCSRQIDIPIHSSKTYACVEGPRLGTRAESLFLRQAGCDLVGMTNVPEVFLAREAQICYCTIAVATDYDCWLDDPSQHASVEKVIELYGKNIGRVQTLLKKVVEHDDNSTECSCHSALKFAVMTKESVLTQEQRQILAFLKE
ncbi:MAG: 5'-methylthioadenosine phosphorylase [Proteobacteria bacterium SG_bin7]|nr:MAG: 5'-methylthioadenosine phosphorylase [Proteobacteria bacterium SG_bin7]